MLEHPYAKFWFVKKFIQTPYKAPHEAVGLTSASAQASKASRVTMPSPP